MVGKSSDWIQVGFGNDLGELRKDFVIHDFPFAIVFKMSAKQLSTLAKSIRTKRVISFMVTKKTDIECQPAKYTEFTLLNRLLSSESECMLEASKDSGIFYKTRMKPSMIAALKKRKRGLNTST
ncbi:hypothetical protein RF11_12627 [Thelohanellus kitauei]|uniref:Uncharacterized protein n=1 Tax=Thelohanellus kitauei TaxID=669202 RepID=A0A0C2MBX7_THEKT|nr:hypothetical protein RF11_12627 [Thelohanellus kitauei]